MLCGTVSCSKTTVILLPDEQQSVGAVVVETAEASKIVDQPYQSLSVTGSTERSMSMTTLEKEAVQVTYGRSLEALPQPAASHTFYFSAGTSTLTESSAGELEKMIDELRRRPPPIVMNIIGHTDATGSKQFNLKLSLKRAHAVEKIITESGIGIDTLRIQSFGENDPLIPTADGVAEPKNRRVEVMVL
jgi:outer membrane protein OmpA-like peptidoglycan-associated protein